MPIPSATQKFHDTETDPMMYRVGARGVLIDAEDRILLALEQITPGTDEFWVPPGGGVEMEDGSVLECVQREFREETGLTVEVGPLLYTQEFLESGGQTRHIGLVFLVHSSSGELHDSDRDVPLQGAELKRHVAWFTRAQLRDIRVYPEELRDSFWRDRAEGSSNTRYLWSEQRSAISEA